MAEPESFHDPLQFGAEAALQEPSHEDDFGGYGDVPLASSDDPLAEVSPITAAATDPLTALGEAPAAVSQPAAAAAEGSAAAAAALAAAAATVTSDPNPGSDPLQDGRAANGAGAGAGAPEHAGAAAAAADPQQQRAPNYYPSVPSPAVRPGVSPLVPPMQLEAPSAGSQDIKISVHSPATLRGPTPVPGLDESFVSFEVTTATSLPSFRSSQTTVRRRFKDVVALARLLAHLLPGAMLPGRPERNFVEGRIKMTPAFVEQRRSAMERYLNRLAAHPSVAASDVLRVWLEADGTLRSSPAWVALLPKQPTPAQATARLVKTLAGMQRAAPTPAEAARPPGDSRDLYRMVHERYAAMRGVVGSEPLGPEEARLRDDGALVEDLRDAFKEAAAKADAWAKATADIAGVWGDLSAALEGLAVFEGTYSTPSAPSPAAAALSCAAKAAAATRALGAESALRLSAALQPLRDHSGAMPNVVRALQQRERQLLTSLTLKRDLEQVQGRLQQAQLAPGTMGKKVEQLRQQAAALEASQAAAAAEYQRLAGRNLQELAALKEARGAELAQAVAHLANVARMHDDQAAAGWGATLSALPPLQGCPVTAYMAQRYFKP